MTDKARVLEWLDQIRTMLPGNHPNLLAKQFEDVKAFVARHASENEASLTFASDEELFRELGARHDAACFIGSFQPDANSARESYRQFTCGTTSSVLGLAQVNYNLCNMNINYGGGPPQDQESPF